MNRAGAVAANQVRELCLERLLHLLRIPHRACRHDQQYANWRRQRESVVRERGRADRTFIVHEVAERAP
jgi:hypothetical protein